VRPLLLPEDCRSLFVAENGALKLAKGFCFFGRDDDLTDGVFPLVVEAVVFAVTLE